MRILILGANGMIGRAMFKVLSQQSDWNVSGSVRLKKFESDLAGEIFLECDLSSPDNLLRLFSKSNPDVVVNCVGLTKHLPSGHDPIPALTMNALLPNRLVELCAVAGARLIHVSTDCVFSGKVGNYRENDLTDAIDIYGKTKALGEVTGESVVTLRTSTIGHEYGTKHGLLEWFLGQDVCDGFRHAIFSGLPTYEFARVVRDVVIPNQNLKGLYHVGASAIDKLSLLKIISSTYKKEIKIHVNEKFRIDRSLNSDKFFNETGYRAADWSKLIEVMYEDYLI
jgi:dTDP-4-dehydrorhamnose reductase